MREVKQQISRELYNQYRAMSTSDFLKEIDKAIPIEWECGYGHYWADLLEQNGKYFIIHTIGSHCD